jgi:hypothetical protein
MLSFSKNDMVTVYVSVQDAPYDILPPIKVKSSPLVVEPFEANVDSGTSVESDVDDDGSDEQHERDDQSLRS